MKTPGDRRLRVEPAPLAPQAAADEHDRSNFGATPDVGVVHLAIPVASIPGRLANSTLGPAGVAERRMPGRRFSGTLRPEYGPAEDLSGLTGTIGVPRRPPLPDPRVPRMEPLDPTPATVIRQPPASPDGISQCP